MSKERSAELDSIRGIAAFVVVLHHCWQVMLPAQETLPFADAAHPIARAIALSPLRLLFAGHAAVGIFFVLSGYVLAQSLARVPMTYAQYVARRICRIWLPFGVAIVFAAGLVLLIAPQPLPGHAWLNLSWNVPVTFQLVVWHLAMAGTTRFQSLDNPMWSLVHEMRLSLVFPLLVLAFTWRPRATLAVTLVALISLSVRHLTNALGASPDGNDLSGLCFSLCQTARYSAFFVLGIWLSQRPDVLLRKQVPKPLLWCLSFALLWIPFTASIIDMAYAIGAFLLIGLCLQSATAHAVLTYRIPIYLGTISYSLYLLHMPIILAFEHVLYGRVNEWLLLTMAVVTALAIATVSYRYVEVPAIRLGKFLAARTTFRLALPSRSAAH